MQRTFNNEAMFYARLNNHACEPKLNVVQIINPFDFITSN